MPQLYSWHGWLVLQLHLIFRPIKLLVIIILHIVFIKIYSHLLPLLCTISYTPFLSYCFHLFFPQSISYVSSLSNSLLVANPLRIFLKIYILSLLLIRLVRYRILGWSFHSILQILQWTFIFSISQYLCSVFFILVNFLRLTFHFLIFAVAVSN